MDAPVQVTNVRGSNHTRGHALRPGGGVCEPVLPGLTIPRLRGGEFIACQVSGAPSHRLIPRGVQDARNGQPLWEVLVVVPARKFGLVLGGDITVDHEYTVPFVRSHGVSPSASPS